MFFVINNLLQIYLISLFFNLQENIQIMSSQNISIQGEQLAFGLGEE